MHGPDGEGWEIYTVLADLDTPACCSARDREHRGRASAEAVGTAFLVAVVVGSGIAAQRLSPGNVGLELLEISTATGAGLVALILALGPVSGAHFNPVVTLAERMRRRCTTGDTLAYTAAQVVGAAAGAIVANLMFGLSAVTLSTHTRSSGGLWLGGLVATFGLLMVILGVARDRIPRSGPRSRSAATSPRPTGPRRRRASPTPR